LNLDEVLRSEFRAAYAGEELTRQPSSMTDLSQVEVFSSEGREECAHFVDSHSFMAFFMVLTVYALFAQDLDTIFGTPQSRFVLSIVTTIVFGLFTIELVLQCLFKAGYSCRAFFWLDMIALMSLLPETWFVQQLFNSDTLVAGRSTRLMKAIRLVVRSSKATRLNRFIRMVRVTAMLPKMCAGLQRKPVENTKDVENLVERKLHRIYVYLEREYDGLVSGDMADAIVRRITKRRKQRRSITRLLTKTLGAPSMTRQNSDVSEADVSPMMTAKTFSTRPRSRSVVVRSTYSDGGDSPDGISSVPLERRLRKFQTSHTTHTDQSNNSQTESCMRGSRGRSRSRGGVTIRIDDDFGTNSMPLNLNPGDDAESGAESETLGRRVEKVQTYRSLHSNNSTPLPAVKKESSDPDDFLNQPIPWQRGISDPVSAENFSHEQSQQRRRNLSRKSTQSSTLSINRNASSASIQTDDDEEPLKFEEFKERVLAEEMVRTKLFDACQSQLGKGTTMKNIGKQHVEDVGVKVALMVIILLFILSFVVPQSQDTSVPLVLEQLDLEAVYRFSDWSNATAPQDLVKNYVIWKDGLIASPHKPTLLYLDLAKRALCNEMSSQGLGTMKCSQIAADGSDVPWPGRVSLASIDSSIHVAGSPYRADDLEFFRHPVVDETDRSKDLDQIVTSVAVMDTRYLNEQAAVHSLFVSWMVIFIILVGMLTITRDLGHLSRKLLEPLRVLADEMQSIAHINLAAIAKEEKTEVTQGAEEVQLIQHIFNKTKVAIISWGRYVPWPVVQNLLVAGVQVKPQLEEREVSLFFSDMAGFTSIVEQLVPEQTLVLLSRYFNDMSKIIESFDGVVIEYIGDAILAVFGAPAKLRDHALACVRATLKMQRGVQKINHWSHKKGLPHVSIRCGIHSGWVSFGNLGFHSRLKFGVIGDHSNVPAKLEELNKTYGTPNLISQATYDRLPLEEFVIRPIDFVDIWHEDDEEPVYEVMSYLGGARPSLRYNLRDSLAQKYKQALNYYENCKFDKAEGVFREVSLQMGHHFGTFDKASVVMRKRASYYQKHPPPEDWKGIWTLPREPNENDGVEDDVVYVSI